MLERNGGAHALSWTGRLGSGLLVALLAGYLAIGTPRIIAVINIGLVAVLLLVCLVCTLILKEQQVLKKMKEDGELIDEDDL